MDQHLAHGGLLQGSPLSILEIQRKGVVGGGVEEVLDFPASPRGLVFVEPNFRLCLRRHRLYPGPVEPDLPRCHCRPAGHNQQEHEPYSCAPAE